MRGAPTSRGGVGIPPEKSCVGSTSWLRSRNLSSCHDVNVPSSHEACKFGGQRTFPCTKSQLPSRIRIEQDISESQHDHLPTPARVLCSEHRQQSCTNCSTFIIYTALRARDRGGSNIACEYRPTARAQAFCTRGSPRFCSIDSVIPPRSIEGCCAYLRELSCRWYRSFRLCIHFGRVAGPHDTA